MPFFGILCLKTTKANNEACLNMYIVYSFKFALGIAFKSYVESSGVVQAIWKYSFSIKGSSFAHHWF